MVMTHVLNDDNALHITYYETSHGKEGVIELTLDHPEDTQKVRVDDLIDVENVEDLEPGHHCTVVLMHADGAIDTLEATHTCLH